MKIADLAHNSRADRAARLPAAKRERLAVKYRAARPELWPAGRREDIEAIVRIVNPVLLTELDDHGPNRSANAAVVPSVPTAASTAVTSHNR